MVIIGVSARHHNKLNPMKSQTQQLPGLHVYRALAVILMILAHAARTQTNMSSLHSNPASAGPFDWPFVAALIIEPIISALFLFIAGFSLVLSRRHAHETSLHWLQRVGRRMGTLYGISVLFALADQGVQWPGVLVSSGVLGIIAVGVFSAGAMLVSPRPWHLLTMATVLGTAATWWLDDSRLSVTGLNAGAGGMLPLVTLAWLGTLAGLIHQRWQMNGLGIALGVTLPLALLALLADAPWVTYPSSEILMYPGDRLQSVLFSLQDLLGLYDGTARQVLVKYWNHGWIFALRVLPVLLLGLMLSLSLIPVARNPVLVFLEWMGQQALNLYILHLVLLALLVVAGVNPVYGWQTLLVVMIIIALAPYMLQWVSFVPLRIGRPLSDARHAGKKR